MYNLPQFKIQMQLKPNQWMNMRAYLHLRSCVGGPKNLLVPHFLDETNRKPMGHGS
jgi:hypothetical protein